jgi:hypothetical protein
MKIIGTIVSVIAIIAIATIGNGFALSILWEWFVMPVFSVGVLGIAEALGLSLVIGFMTYQSDAVSKKEEEGNPLLNAFLLAVFRPVFILFMGWLITLFL